MKEFPLPEFTGEPTADADIAAEFMRGWYEANRETWWERHSPFGAGPDREGSHADEFMLALMAQCRRVETARREFDASGTGRIRPLAKAKQATSCRRPKEGTFR